MTRSLTSWIRSSTAAFFVAAGCAMSAAPAQAASMDLSAFNLAVSFEGAAPGGPFDYVFDGATTTNSSYFGLLRDNVLEDIQATSLVIDVTPDAQQSAYIKLFNGADLLLSGEVDLDTLGSQMMQQVLSDTLSVWLGSVEFEFSVLYADPGLGMGGRGRFDWSGLSFDQPYLMEGNGDITWTSMDVPEPASIALAGMAGLAALRRARMRRG